MKKIYILGLALVLTVLEVSAGTKITLVNINSSPIDEEEHLLYWAGDYAYGSIDKASVDSRLFDALVGQGFNINDPSENASWKQITAIDFAGSCNLNFADIFVLRYMAGFDSKGTGTEDKVSLDVNSRITGGKLSSINLENVTFVKEEYRLCFIRSSDANANSKTSVWTTMLYFDPKWSDEYYNKNRIPDNAFNGLPSLEEVILSKNCTGIGERAFANNTKLKTIDFSKCVNLEKIERYAFLNTVVEKFDFSKCTKLKLMEEGCLSATSSKWLIMPPNLEEIGKIALEAKSDQNNEAQYIENIVFICKKLPKFGNQVMAMMKNDKHGMQNELTRVYVPESLIDKMLENTVIYFNMDSYGLRLFPLFEGSSTGLTWRTFSYFRPLDVSTLTGLTNGHTDDIKAHIVKSYSNVLGPVLEDASVVTDSCGFLIEGKGLDGELYFCGEGTVSPLGTTNLLVGHWEGGFVPNAIENHYFMLNEGKFIPMLNEGEMPPFKAYLDLSETMKNEEE